MEFLILSVIAIIILFLLGAPIYLCFAVGGSIGVLFFMDAPGMAVAQIVFQSVDSWTLLAVPLFIFTGAALFTGGLAQAIIDFADSLMGHLLGGVAMVSVFACMFLGAISGSSAAIVAAVGGSMAKPMAELGYDRRFALALISCAAGLGQLIPPSGILIIYGLIAEQSVAHLFMAGIMPGVMIGVLLMVASSLIASRKNYGRHPSVSWHVRWRSFRGAVPALSVPLIIIGGIYSGVFTPTEAGAIAAFVSIIVSRFAYGGMKKWAAWKEVMTTTLRATSMVFLIIGCCVLFSTVLNYSGVLSSSFEAIADHFTVFPFYIICMLIWLVLGCVLDQVATIYLTVPFLLPGMVAIGGDPILFGILLTAMANIGLVTPPVGMNIYIASGLYGDPLETLFKHILPFTIVMLIGAVLLLFFPGIALWLPHAIGMGG